MEIIDCHTHLNFQGERLEWNLWPTLEACIAVQQEAGITSALAGRGWSVERVPYEELMERNKCIADVCLASNGFYHPSAEISPALGKQACELLKRCREEWDMRFIGEMFDHWKGYQWGTTEYYRFIECAIELRMIPLIHCLNDVAREIGQRYPEGKFLIAHSLDEKGHDREDVLKHYPNLYLDISGSDIARARELEERVATIGIEHVVFGSDIPAVDPFIAVQCVMRSGLSEDEKAKVFASNFRKLREWTEV